MTHTSHQPEQTAGCRVPTDEGLCGASTTAFMCKSHGAELERTLAEYPSLMHEVSVVALGQAKVYRASSKQPDSEQHEQDEAQSHRWDTEQRRVPARLRSRDARIALPSTRLMVNLDAREVLADAWGTLAAWARHLAESRAVELPPSDQVLTWLTANAESFRWDEAAGEAFDELTYAARQMRHAVDRRASRVYAGPCHADLEDGKRCQASLYTTPGAELITCDGWRPPTTRVDAVQVDGCGATHAEDARKEWKLAAFDEALLPLDEWRDALPRLMADQLGLVVPRKMFTTWQRNGRLVARSLDMDGVELFRGGDVVDLMIAYRPHAYAPRPSARTA